VLVADGKPGEEAQIDFGLMGTLVDVVEGRPRRLQALVVTLVVASRIYLFPTISRLSRMSPMATRITSRSRRSPRAPG